MQPEITVLMSCYNAEAWLDEAIESVLSQTYKNFEFILVDDGSTDNTLHLIQKHEKIDSRIKVITKVNTGLSDSLNVGIAQAQGTWTARIDADDICEPTRLEKQLDFVKNRPQTILLGTGFLEIDANGEIIKQHQYPTEDKVLKSNLEKCLRFFPHSSAFYRTANVQAIGGYNKKYANTQDWDLWLRLSESGELACLNEPLVRIRQHQNQISHAGSGKVSTIEVQMARTTHFLRKLGFKDPTTEDESEWIGFRDWVEQRVDEEGIFEIRKTWLTARGKFFRHNNRLIGALDFTKHLFSSANPATLIKNQFMGSDLPRRLAQQWMQVSALKTK
jgi:glycosyltransferase involved in cell wall biosynthesis